MKISRDSVVKLLRERGHFDRAAQAELHLPEEFDADKAAGDLTAYGVNPLEVSAQDSKDQKVVVNRQHLVRRLPPVLKPPAK